MMKTRWIATSCLSALLISCTQEIAKTENSEQPERIELNANLVQVASRTTGIVLPGQAITDIGFVRCDGEVTHWESASTIIPAEVSAIAAGAKVLFTPTQFYPTNGDKVHLSAYHPATGAVLSAGIVTYTPESMTGQQDIMYAPAISGSKTEKFNAPCKFQHQLAQLRFKLVKGAGFPDGLTVTSLTVEGTAKPQTLAIVDGTIGYASQASPLNVFTGKAYLPTVDGVEPSEAILIQPAVTFTLTVELSDGTVLQNIPVSSINTQPSHSHLITLTFVQGSITCSAEIAPWKNGDEANGKVQ